jgi:hypothetical protein
MVMTISKATYLEGTYPIKLESVLSFILEPCQHMHPFATLRMRYPFVDKLTT